MGTREGDTQGVRERLHGRPPKIISTHTLLVQIFPIGREALCSGELGGLCCRWSVYHQNLDMIDEMKHLIPGAWIWKKHFTIVLFAVRRRPEVCCLCLITAVENMSVQFVFWGLGPLSKTCLLQKRLPVSAVKAIWSFSTYAVIVGVWPEQYF